MDEESPARRCPALAGASRSAGLLLKLKAAADEAIRSERVVAALLEREPKLSKNHKVAKVFIGLLGLEQRQGAGEMENLGKLICREEVRIKKSINNEVVTTRNHIATMKARCKEGCEAAVAAQVEARKARSEADQLALLEKRSTSLGQGPVLQPAAIVQHRVQLQHGVEPCESTRSATVSRSVRVDS